MIDLYFEESGVKSEPLLVLLPGLLASINYWRKIALELEKDYRIIIIDQLGFGKSPKPDDQVDYTIQDNIDAYNTLFQKYQIKQIDILVGFSSSSILASEFVLQNPQFVKNLLLITPPFLETKKSREEFLIQTFPTYRYFMKTALKFAFIPFVTVFRPILRYFAKYLITHIDEESAKDAFSFTWKSLYETINNIIIQQNILTRIDQIKIPTKILYSKKDDLKNDSLLEEICLRQPNFQLEEVEATHQIPFENPLKVIKVIKSMK